MGLFLKLIIHVLKDNSNIYENINEKQCERSQNLNNLIFFFTKSINVGNELTFVFGCHSWIISMYNIIMIYLGNI